MPPLALLLLLAAATDPVPLPLGELGEGGTRIEESAPTPVQAPPTPGPGFLVERDGPFHGTPYSIVDATRNFSGGAEVGNALRTLTGFTGELDLDALIGLSGATLFADLQWIAGDNAADLVGDIQWTSNIDSDEERFQLAELWWEQRLESARLRFKLGKIDANTEFAYVESGGDFIHPSSGISPTLFPTPTYPDPASGVNLCFEDVHGFSLGVGVYDGTGERLGSRGPSSLFSGDPHFFGVVEARYAWGETRFGVGAWYHTGDFERWDGGIEETTGGYYGLAEGRLTREGGEGAESEQGLQAWTMLGATDDAVTDIGAHVGAGLLYTGLVPGRDEDLAGLGVNSAWLSTDPDAVFTERREVAYELFYSLEVLPQLRVQPDLQYVINPGGEGLDDAIVGTLRLILEI